MKMSNIPFQFYRISHLLSSNPPYIAVPKVLLNQTTPMYLKYNPSDLHQIQQLKVMQEVTQMVQLFLELMAMLKNK